MSNRDTLLQALINKDEETIQQLGWGPVFLALRDWWGGHRLDLQGLTPYVDALGNEDPQAVLTTLRGLLEEEWRPNPSRVYRDLKQRTAQATQQEARVQGTASRRPDRSPASLHRVHDLMAAGEHVCDCNPRPTQIILEDLTGYRWTPADWANHRKRDRKKQQLPDHVTRCAHCKGLEQGQVYEAEDTLG